MGRLSPVPPAAKIERQASRLTNDWAICQSQTGPLSFWSRGQQPRGVCTRRRLWAAARDLQTEGRRRRWRDATHKSAPLFPLATGEQYDALTFANKKKFRAAGRCTLDKLDQQAAEEKTRAQKNLFHPCSRAEPKSACQTDHGHQAGSSRTHAAIRSPNKKRKAEPEGWSPASTLLAKHWARDGLRPKYRTHVGFTPEKKYDPVD